MRRISRGELAGLLAVVFIYWAGATYQLELPGLHYDEAFEAVPAVQLIRNQPVTAFRGSGLNVAGRLLPYTTQDYIGAVNTYLSLPFLAILGPSAGSLRLYAVGLGCLTLLLAWRFSRALTRSAGAGLAAAALLAVNPTFVFWNRQGVFVTAVAAAIGLGAALCWLKWLRGGGARYALAGAFLFGLGLYAKLLFIWLIVALGGAALLLTIDRWWPALRARRWPADLAPVPSARFAGALLLALLLGCWPLFAYNVQSGGTLASLRENAATSYYGVRNLALGANLLERLKQMGVLLESGHLWYLGGVEANLAAPVVFGLALLAVGGTASLRVAARGQAEPPAAGSARPALLPLVVIGLVVGQSIVTVSALWITHFAILMPWPAIALAGGGHFLWRRWGRRRLIRPVLLALLALLLAADLLTTLAYHRDLSLSGGLGAHSDAVYELAAWLEENAGGPVVAMDWGLAAPVIFLTEGRVTPVEAFGYAWETDTGFADRLAGFVSDPAALYLWRAPDEIIFDRSADFKAIYRRFDLEETIVAAFYERSGRPVLGITRLVPAGTAENPP